MTVFLVEWSVPYEGSEVMGVFSTFRLAKDFIESKTTYEQKFMNIEEWVVES